MAHQVKALKMEITQWDKTLQTAISSFESESESRKQAGKINKLEESVSQLKAAKQVAREEIKRRS